MNIELKDKNGITLKTAGKYCSSDVVIIPKLQSKSVATNGSVVADEGYCGLDSVTVDVPATPTQEKTVDLAMASGDQVIPPDSGYDLSKVTVKKPSTLVASNIKTGVSIGGVTGTLEAKKDEEAKTVDLAMASGNQTITPTSGKTLSQVVVKKPTTMLPENIKKDVNIGGVTGTLEIGGGGELNIAYGDTAPEDTSKLWIKSEEPSNISFPVVWKPEQIVEGVTNTGATLPTAANGIRTAAVGTKIYLFGGYGNNGSINTINVFDTTNNTIQTLSAKLPQGAYGIGTAAVGTKIYLFGGYGSDSLNTINQFTVDVPLSSNDIIVTQEYYSRTFKVMKAPTEVEVACKYVYKGDQNLAKFIDAYLYDGANWVNVNTGNFTFTKLYAPKISISGKTLTITNDGRNGSKVTNYKVYNGSTLLTTITATTLDLTTVITTNGTYNISVIATGTGYTDSDSSNVVEYNYAVYNITTNLTGVTANASNPTTVSTLASSTLTFTANTGYNLPDNVTVTGAEFTWTKSSGTLVLSNPTGNVSVTVAGVAISRTITPTLTNVTAASGNATTIATGETKVLTYTANSGYTVPDSVTVTGATGIWNKDAGTLTLSNPTANVTFTIAGVEAASGYTVIFEGVTNSVMGNHDYAPTYAYDGQDTNGTSTDITNGATVSCSSGYIYVKGYVYDSGLDSEPTVTGGVVVESSGVTDYKAWILFKVTGNGTVSTISFNCFIEGTQITLADGTTKAIEDITYDDELLVWNFYDGKFDTAKPTWIKVEETAPRYDLVKFSDGREFGTVGAGGEKGYHRVFNKEAGAFTHIGTNATPIGTTTFADDGTNPTIISEEIIEKPVKYYNIITDKHYNIFANGILTSCRLSNKYHIEDMKYICEPIIYEQEEKEYRERLEKNRKWLG